MIQVISIHLPRTAGTTFYQILRQVYGERLSISYRRRDYRAAVSAGAAFRESIAPEISVMHGHLFYREVRDLHLRDRSKIICWLRDPTQRVISNFRFFKHGLNHPARNPVQYALNKHRLHESLLEYARMEENRNRMTKFLEGIDLQELFFFGMVESFSEDLERLGKRLHWPDVEIPHLNQVPGKKDGVVAEEVVHEIQQLNALDEQLYRRAWQLKNSK